MTDGKSESWKFVLQTHVPPHLGAVTHHGTYEEARRTGDRNHKGTDTWHEITEVGTGKRWVRAAGSDDWVPQPAG